MFDAPDPLIDRIYASTLQPDLWASIILEITDRLGGNLSALTRFDLAVGKGDVLAPRSDPATIPAYAAHYWRTNPFTRSEGVDSYVTGWRPRVSQRREHVDWDWYLKSEFFNDFLGPQGVGEGLMLHIAVEGQIGTTLNVGRSLKRGGFEASEIAAAEALTPHLARALRMGRMLGDAGASGDLADALDRSRNVVLIVDAHARIRLANPPAQRLLSARRGLQALHGRLTANLPDTARRLEKLIGEATRPDGVRVGGGVRVPLPETPLPLSLQVSPMGAERHPAAGHRLAMICVHDPESPLDPPTDALRDLFDLSPGEIRVAAAVFEGLTLAEAGARFGVSVNTVRFQLARIFDKTGVSRQAELVKLMLRLADAPDA